MLGNPVKEFGDTARGLARNPLGIIALFIVLVYGLASLVVITGQSLTSAERAPLIYFLICFPVVVLAVFTWLVIFRSGQLFSPADFRDDDSYLEIQRMSYVAVASLAVSKQKDRSSIEDINVDELAQSVRRAVNLVQEGADNPSVLWVDDRPDNNIFERKAMESVGIKFTLAQSTREAIAILRHKSFGAIISDMGRREGPREGYVLLDSIRADGDKTPLFFYASSNAPEHKRETTEHGGQGCTNDGQELFEMVTSAVFGSRSRSRRS